MVTLAERLREAAERQFQFGTFDAQARVCLCLLALADRYGQAADERVTFTMPFSQHDLAAWAGISREALVRALRSLRATGAVATQGLRFEIAPDLLRGRSGG